MRFLIIRKADDETEAGAMPTEELVTDMMAYTEAMTKAGVMLSGDGLQPSAKGVRVSFTGGKPTVTDGPFAETKELIAGFTMIDVKSKEAAIEWLKRWPPIDGHGRVQLELRQLYEADDFGEEFAPAIRQQEARLRARDEASVTTSRLN